MASDERTFTVATGDAVLDMVQSAKRRLVVIAPALSQAVANALASRFDELADLDIPVTEKLTLFLNKNTTFLGSRHEVIDARADIDPPTLARLIDIKVDHSIVKVTDFMSAFRI